MQRFRGIHIFELNISKFTEFGNGIVSDFSWNNELH